LSERAAAGFRLVDFGRVKIGDKIKNLIRRRPPTKEELAARAEAEIERQRIRYEVAIHANQDNTHWHS
jgi:hypothetical protein